MSSPIYLQNGTDELNKWLMQQLAMKQQHEIEKEQINLRKKQLEQDAAEHQFQQQKEQAAQAQIQGPQLAAQQVLHNLLGQAAGGAVGAFYGPNAYTQPVEAAPQAAVNYAQLQRTAQPAQALAAAPGYAKTALQEVQQKKLDAAMLKSLTPQEFEQYKMGDLVYQHALAASGGDEQYARNQSASLMPPTAKDAADTAEANQRMQGTKDQATRNAEAAQALSKRFKMDVPADDNAPKLLAWAYQNDITFRQNRELTLAREQGANARTITARQTQIQENLRQNFQNNPIIRSIGTVAAPGYAKLKELGAKGVSTWTGHDDVAAIDAMVRLATGTVVRAQQVELIKSARSVPEGVRVLLGNWLTKGGRKLSDTQRTNIVATADAMIEPYKRQYEDVTNMFRKQADANGVDANLFITDPFVAIPEQYRMTAAERRKKALGQ